MDIQKSSFNPIDSDELQKIEGGSILLTVCAVAGTLAGVYGAVLVRAYYKGYYDGKHSK